jgi:hypothetical protein
MFSHGNLREMSTFGIVLYSNRYRRLTYDYDESGYDESDYDGYSADSELGGCDSGDAVWYLRGFRALPFFILKPKLKIESAETKFLYDAKEVNAKRVAILKIRNVGKRSAHKVKVKVQLNILVPDIRRFDPVLLDFETLYLSPFDLAPDDQISIELCQLGKVDKKIVFPWSKEDLKSFYPLEIGNRYELLVRFVGINFSDRKVWRFHLLADTYDGFFITR